MGENLSTTQLQDTDPESEALTFAHLAARIDDDPDSMHPALHATIRDLASREAADTVVDDGQGFTDDQASQPATDGRDTRYERFEKLYGFREGKTFDAAIAEKLAAEMPFDEWNVRERGEILEDHGVAINPAVSPKAIELQKLDLHDWEAVRESGQPLLVLYAADNVHRLRSKIVDTEPNSNKLLYRDPRAGSGSMEAEATIKSLPLIHGTTTEAFLGMLKSGNMTSNRGRYEATGSDIEKLMVDKQGKTNIADRKDGLDKYVFFDYARPNSLRQQSTYKQQPEITLVVDPSVMEQPGTFMTDHDIADVTASRYMFGLTTPEYFAETAALRIATSPVESGRDSGNNYTRYNKINDFINGKGGDIGIDGKPTFSTFEVKVPDPPGISTEAIRKVIVRDKDTFDELQASAGGRFEIIYEPELKAMGLDTDESSETCGEIVPGNYNILRLPELYEQTLDTLIQGDYDTRVKELELLPDTAKAQQIIVFGSTDPSQLQANNGEVDGLDVRTDPYRFGDVMMAEYSSMEELQYDTSVRTTDQFSSALGQPTWFMDTRSRQYGAQTESGNCVIAVAEYSKANPRLVRLVNVSTYDREAMEQRLPLAS